MPTELRGMEINGLLLPFVQLEHFHTPTTKLFGQITVGGKLFFQPLAQPPTAEPIPRRSWVRHSDINHQVLVWEQDI